MVGVHPLALRAREDPGNAHGARDERRDSAQVPPVDQETDHVLAEAAPHAAVDRRSMVFINGALVLHTQCTGSNYDKSKPIKESKAKR
jgi:hypothetical protein